MKNWRSRLRLLPVAIAAVSLLLAVKAESLWRGVPGAFTAQASDTPAPRPAPPAAPRPAAVPATPPPLDPEAIAERAVLDTLRARRADLERREAAAAAREAVLAVAERRLDERIEALAEQNRRLETAERGRTEREDGAWRGLVRTYETMRPASAAAILEEMEMPVLVQIMDRMGERRAGPILGAMRPDRARLVTAELARYRTARPAGG
ncbi:MotE family protein [Humitalea sp. 24SJ18S-53]|uniref:MotE family protein n=1 Tax=Humitalea sp. 24SJ18S-53 TaxID=3422307 RepID=UPI003D670848